MIDEKFFVVDDKDRPTNVIVGKEELHKFNHKHRAVHVFMERPRTKNGPSTFILQKKGKGTENEGKLSSTVSGHVCVNETYEKAAVREIYEEVGLIIHENELIEVAYVQATPITGNEFIKLYSYLLDENEILKPNPEEVKELITTPLKDIYDDINTEREKFSEAFIALLNIFTGLHEQNSDLNMPQNNNDSEMCNYG